MRGARWSDDQSAGTATQGGICRRRLSRCPRRVSQRRVLCCGGFPPHVEWEIVLVRDRIGASGQEIGCSRAVEQHARCCDSCVAFGCSMTGRRYVSWATTRNDSLSVAVTRRVGNRADCRLDWVETDEDCVVSNTLSRWPSHRR